VVLGQDLVPFRRRARNTEGGEQVETTAKPRLRLGDAVDARTRKRA
jgi:hypothetical protein